MPDRVINGFNYDQDRIEHPIDNLIGGTAICRRIFNAIDKYQDYYLTRWNTLIGTPEGIVLARLDRDSMIIGFYEDNNKRCLYLTTLGNYKPSDNSEFIIYQIKLTFCSGNASLPGKTDLEIGDAYLQFFRSLLQTIPQQKYVLDWPAGEPPCVNGFAIREEQTNLSRRQQGAELSFTIEITIGPQPIY